MPDISEAEIPYEVLVRLAASEDEPGWTLAGAHIQTRRILRIDGVVRADEIQPARPLGAQDGPVVAALIAHFQQGGAA
ncbi:hypothetical protein [Zavarzinia sp. CC-PAN008]|uniref:hypothetical protein n=1 Tax=Zavarzinia sp. CC-PAN008 TaxID=3243332 RepID=UPI003F749E1A